MTAPDRKVGVPARLRGASHTPEVTVPENVPQGADLTELGRQGLEVVQGPALIGAAVARARDLGVQVLQLTVTEGNDAARRLYEACGFQCWGVEPAAVQLGERLLGKAHLWRELR